MKESSQGRARWAVTVGLAVMFGAVYPLVRAIPTPQCGVLHATNLRETEGGVEFCGPAAAVFVDLQTTRFPVRARWEASGPARTGESLEYALRLETSAGRPLGESDLAVVHTRKVHLLVVDPTLEDYQHLHPEWDERRGWVGSFTPQRPGTYRIYAEMVPIASATPVLAVVTQTVAPGGGAPPGDRPDLALEDYAVELEFLTGEPRTGQESELRLVVKGPGDAGTVPLSRIMGAWAHLVAFDATGRGVAHLHPLDEGSGLETAAPAFGFGFRTDLPGRYRFWAQLVIEGEERFVPFDFQVGAAGE